MHLKSFHISLQLALIAAFFLFRSDPSIGLETTSIFVSREQSFNDQIEHLAIVDILLTERNIAWILTTDGLYRYNTAQAKKILTSEQLNLDLDFNITELKLLLYADKIGIHNQESMMLLDPVTFDRDMVYAPPALTHNCTTLESRKGITVLEYEGTKCNVSIKDVSGKERKFRVNQTTALTERELLLSTTSGLLFLDEKSKLLLDTSNSNFVDNFILSAAKLTEEQFLIGTYKGLYFGYKNSGFLEKRALGIPSAENITDFLIDTDTKDTFLLTDQALYRSKNDGSAERLWSLHSEARILAKNDDYLITTFINDKHCFLYLGSTLGACVLIENPEAIDKITSLIYSDQLDSFIGTTLNGDIVRIYAVGEKLLRLERIKKVEDPLTLIVEYSSKYFLIGGIDSLSLFKIQKQNQKISTKLEKSYSTDGATVYDIKVLGDQLLAGTSKGIIKSELRQFDSLVQEDISFSSFFNERAVPTINSTKTHLAFTTASTLWYSELKNPTEFKQLRIRNLFPDFEFEFGISGKTADGKLVFGGAGGLLIWDGDQDIPTAPPILNFTGFSVNGESLELPITAEEVTSVLLSHEAYHFKVDFAVMDYINPSQNRYEYMLEGFDVSWIDGEVAGSATYTNLPPGDYKLRVRGANSLGVWSEEEISLDITINPAWWLSWWAFSAYFALIAWVAVAGKRHYDNVKLHRRAMLMSKEMVNASEDQMAIMERRNRTLSRSVENQTRLLKHFIKDLEVLAPAYPGSDLTQWLSEMQEASQRLMVGSYTTDVSCDAIGNIALEIVSRETNQRGLQCIGLVESPSPYVRTDLTFRIYALVVELARWLTAHLSERRISRIALTLSFFEIGTELGIRVSCSHSLVLGSDPMGHARIRLLLKNLDAQLSVASDRHAVEVMIDNKA